MHPVRDDGLLLEAVRKAVSTGYLLPNLHLLRDIQRHKCLLAVERGCHDQQGSSASDLANSGLIRYNLEL